MELMNFVEPENAIPTLGHSNEVAQSNDERFGVDNGHRDREPISDNDRPDRLSRSVATETNESAIVLRSGRRDSFAGWAQVEG